jgi:hypothetical protein
VVEQLNRLQPPGLGAALLRLEHNWRKRRPGEAFELYSFHGLREAESADEHYSEEDVYYLWADAGVGSSIRAKVVASDPRITEIRYENKPTGFPGNVALRPNGRNLAAQASGRFKKLRFEACIPEGATTSVTFGIRVVDALSTHWEYCRVPHEYHLMTVKPGEGWKEFVIPLDSTLRWSVFTADGNSLYHDDTPDFSQVLAVVIEVGSKGAGRPGAGKGAIQLRCLRAE